MELKSNMLSQKNRITGKKDFERIFKKGKSFKEKFLILKVAPNSLNINRFAFIVSRKVSKKATVRNKIKRQIRELTRLQIDKAQKGVDGIFIVLPGLENRDSLELKNIFNNLFKKAKLT